MKHPEDVIEEFVLLIGKLDRPLMPEVEFDRICRTLDAEPAALSDFLSENFGFSGPEIVFNCAGKPNSS